MGRKRKQEKSEEEIRRKIKKLQDQLQKTTNKSVKSSSDDSTDGLPLATYRSPLENLYDDPICCESPEPDTFLSIEGSLYPPSLCPPSLEQASPRASPRASTRASPRGSPRASPRVLPQPAALSPQPGTSGEGNKTNSTDELVLDDEILQLLGDAPKTETPLGSSIHKDVARRWQDILTKGLPKDVREKIAKDYLVPGNCDLLLAPALNPEVKAAIPDTMVKRDSSLLYKQKHLGIALAALATVTDLIIADETSKQKLLKPLSDACRLLCDNHHSMTTTRKNYFISAINTKLKDVLIESKRDNFLFGENVSEKLKTAKTILQSGDALKNVQRPKFQRSNVASTGGNSTRGRLNYVPQHRKTDNKPNDGRRAAYAQTQRQSTNNNARRPNDRSVPTRTTVPQRR